MGQRQTETSYQSEVAYLKSVLLWLQDYWTGPAPRYYPVCTGRARIEAPRQTRLTFSTKDVAIKASDPLASARCDIELSDYVRCSGNLPATRMIAAPRFHGYSFGGGPVSGPGGGEDTPGAGGAGEF
jgi:hypothetical protein